MYLRLLRFLRHVTSFFFVSARRKYNTFINGGGVLVFLRTFPTKRAHFDRSDPIGPSLYHFQVGVRGRLGVGLNLDALPLATDKVVEDLLDPLSWKHWPEFLLVLSKLFLELIR